MKYIYKGYVIDYSCHYVGDQYIVYLHGWMGNKNSFAPISKYLQNYSSLSISFPPYPRNESVLPLTMQDYTQIVINLLHLHNIQYPIIVCHSFGCRVALMLNSKIKIQRLVITSGAGIKPKKSICYKLDNYKKIMDNRQLHFNTTLGSKDYQALDYVDKITFKNIVNLDLKNRIQNIHCPTLIFWGKKDKETKPYMAKIFKKKIINSKLIMIDGDHFAYLKNSQFFLYVTKNFIEDNR